MDPVSVSATVAASDPGTASGSSPVKQFVDYNGVRIAQYSIVPPVTIDPTARYVALIKTNQGNMEIELFPGEAPIAVNNFIFLANDGFYDGVVFHRVIPSFMIQSGDPTGTGTAGPGYRFQDEFVPNLTFDQPGRLAMANSGPGTNGSQFFVTTVPTPHLDGAHTIFGQVTNGQDVADAISLVQTSAGNKPTSPIVIQGIVVIKKP
jgi:cyclophilin family peptidyl-prolyl cis-trans isomerase